MHAGTVQLRTLVGQIDGMHVFPGDAACGLLKETLSFQALLESEHKAKPLGKDIIRSDPGHIGTAVTKLKLRVDWAPVVTGKMDANAEFK